MEHSTTPTANTMELYIIFIKTLAGSPIHVTVNDTTTVKEVKEEVVKLGIASEVDCPEAIHLVFAGKRLEDDRKLAYYNIQKETSLHAVLNREWLSRGKNIKG